MVSETFDSVAKRLEHVREITRAPSKSAFAAWIGANSPQTVQQWEARDHLTSRGAVAIAEATGADPGWLLTGKGKPFPSGAQTCPSEVVVGPVTDKLVSEVQALWVLVGALAQVVATGGQAASTELLTLLRADPVTAERLADSPRARALVARLQALTSAHPSQTPVRKKGASNR